MSPDEILSSTKYALSARKTWTRDELLHAKCNVKIVKSAKKTQSPSKTILGSPTKYKFPSRDECLRRLGSPVKGKGTSRGESMNNTFVKRHKNTLINDDDLNEMRKYCQEVSKPKRSSPRLKSASKQSVTKNDLCFDSTNKTEGIEITTASLSSRMPNNVPMKQSTAADCVSNLLQTYSTCLEKGTKSTWEVVELLPPLLDFLDKKNESRDEKTVHEGLGRFVKSVESARAEVINRNSINDVDENEKNKNQNENTLLRLLQIQIWIRIMIWNFNREEGYGVLRQLLESNEKYVKADKIHVKSKGRYKKKGKMKSKSDNHSPGQSVIKDITMLFELVPYVLPPSVEFSQWVKDTLTFGFQQSIPEFGMEILDHFEIDFVENSTEMVGKNDTARRSSITENTILPFGSTSSDSKQVIKGKTQQQAYFSSLATQPLSVNADGESATITSEATIAARSHRSSSSGSTRTTIQSDKVADKSLFKKSVSLTAAVPKRKENPFLKHSARGVYVGSHFSSKLSNISSLFREVKTPTNPKPTAIAAKRKDPPKKSISSVMTSVNSKSANMPLTKTQHDKASSAIAFVNNKYKTSHQPFNLPPETPRKRLKPAPDSRFSNINLPSVNVPAAATPRQIIGETPAKQFAVHRKTTCNPSNNGLSDTTNNVVGATPLQIIGETPAKQPQKTARRLKPNALDGIFVRHASGDMTPQPLHAFGLSPIPGIGQAKSVPKETKKKF